TLSRRIPRCWLFEERFRGEDTQRATGSRKMPDTFSSAMTPGGDPATTPIMRLGHLYPDQLNMYGDRGNIIVLHERCAWRGITLQVTPLDLGEPLDPAAYDMLFVGGGQDKEQDEVARDLREVKADGFVNAVEA